MATTGGRPPTAGGRVPQLGEHLVGVLAQARGHPPRAARGPVEVGRHGHHRRRRRSVGHLHDPSGGDELRVGQQVVDGVDRRPEEVGFGGEDLRPRGQVPGGEDLVEQRHQLGGVGGAVAPGGEAGIGQPFRVAHGSGQRRPVPFALEPDDPEAPAVAGHVVVEARVAHGRARPDPDALAPHQGGVEIEPDGVGPLAQQRRRDELAAPGALARHEGGADHARRRHRHRVITHPAPLERQRTARRCEQAGDAGAGPPGGDVVGGGVRLRPLGAVAGDDAVHQARVARQQAGVVEPDARQRRPPDVGDEHVGLVDQPAGELPAGLGGEIDDDAALVAVVELEGWVARQIAAEHPLERTRRVPAGRLDLDHVGAPVGEDGAGGRTGDPHPHLDDAHPLQRTAHGGAQ